MATVEGLFNFDEKLLARQVAGQREDAMFGNSMPKGYGAIGSGWNQMLRGIFNNDNPILKEKAIAEEALQMTQQQLGGDMTDPAKMYSILMKNLTDLGASPDSITKVSQRQTEAAASQAASSLATSQQEFNNLMKLSDLDSKNMMNQNTIEKTATKGIEVIEKQLENKLKVEPDYFKNMAKGLLNSTNYLGADFNGDTTATALAELTGMFVRAKGPNGKALFNGLLDAETEAKQVLKDSNPEATHFWGADKLNTNSEDPNSLYNLAERVITSRGGAEGVQSGRVAAEIPENLTKVETEAWTDAQARLAKDPQDANSLKVIQLLSN
tara:strand:- start:1215 stop:2189 length:975 start_codon:yes stop_codon:yes gene_type:complete